MGKSCDTNLLSFFEKVTGLIGRPVKVEWFLLDGARTPERWTNWGRAWQLCGHAWYHTSWPGIRMVSSPLIVDLIFTQCAHGSLDSIAASSATSNSTSVDQVQSSGSVETFSLELLSSQDDLLLHDNKPIPPPRFKRKNKSALPSLHLVNPDKQVELSTTYESTTELAKSSVEPTANSQVLLDIINEKLSCPTTCPTGQKATPGLLDNSAIPEHSTEIDDSSYPGGESVSLSTSPFFTPSPLNDLELLKKYGLNFTSLRVKSPGLSSCSSSITDTSSTSNSSKPLPQQTTQK
ncbi:uncharacterized protein LOC111086928 [Limulus polyphemus]|uniref:Uncharacterized protein LOC111086928 n=1 Tax=Limulus polyphemus TaxID=6850 RepID=A0ABM1SV31_LIMPO|nr:uncharacterized protein LOC111086928 [Limulus polyphemus]